MFPYDDIAPFQNWRKALSAEPASPIDPQAGARFRIDRETKVASAGSCFASRIAESLQEYGFHYHVTEPGPAWLTPAQRVEYGYGVFSARYGNIYTTLQLLQLIQRALGTFSPRADYWKGQNGEYIDPFRPSIQPAGFASLEELHADRAHHLAAVKRLIEASDVFVFTLGLTEGFCDRFDDAAFPQCPGRAHGDFDPEQHSFRNLSVADNVAYLREAIELMRALNPNLRIILTVSPVPLAATMESRHVIASTSYSKAVLRVVADEMQRAFPFVDYFASYEIITGTFNNALYFQADRRNVTAAGIDHVMWSFYRNYFGQEISQMPKVAATVGAELSLIGKPCDEELLLRHLNADFAESAG